MKKSSLFSTSIILMFFFAGLISQTAAQGIRNEGATINVASGCYVVCQGGFNNNSGALTNDGVLTVTGAITNPVSATIEGDGSYNIGGNLFNNGTFTQAAGTTTFNGTGAQTISGSSLTTFNSLIIDALSSGTTIAAGTRVTVAGSTFSPNGKLAINSDAVNNSGSLIYSGSGTPSGNITYSRTMPGSSTIVKWHYVSSPAGSPSPSGSFYEWNETTGLWEVNPINTATNPLASGRGYTLETDGNSVSFTGPMVLSTAVTATSPYTTDYSTGSLAEYNARIARSPFGGGGWNLLGNPFTSAMTIADFLEANDGDGSYSTNKFDPNYVAVYIYDGSKYFFRGKTTGFIDPIENETPANQIFGFENIQAGQGFFVLAMKNGVSFAFDKAMQTHGTGTTMLKSAEAENSGWPGLRLKVKYGEKESSTLVVFNENMTPGLDPGYDLGLLSAYPDVEIYTALVLKDNSVNFAQQALPLDDYDKNIIPVGIDSEEGGQVTFSAFTVPLGDNKFWLEDRKAGTFTDLNNNTYKATIPAQTYGTGRFYIIASVNTPTGIGSETEADGNDLRIWTSDSKVIIKGAVSDRASCEIFDTGGRKVVMTRLTDGELNTVTMPSVSKGVFLVRVIDEGKVTTGKIAIL